MIMNLVVLLKRWFLFTTHFTKFRVEFTRQQTNEVAHAVVGNVTLLVGLIIHFNIPVILTILFLMKFYKKLKKNVNTLKSHKQ